MTCIVGISGGIGAGKSVVARVLRTMGYPVYDCDSHARTIMDSDPEIHRLLCEMIHPGAVTGGCVDRRLISEVVFADPEALRRLNSIVHSAVFEDFKKWVGLQSSETVFVESAILHSSGLDQYVTHEWNVTAPTDLRILRVAKRSSLTEEQIRARIKSQDEEEKQSCAQNCTKLINDSMTALIPQIHSALESLRN